MSNIEWLEEEKESVAEMPSDEELDSFCYADNVLQIDGTRHYFETIKEYKTLTREEEFDLFKRIKNGDQEAVNLMILHNLKLSVYVAKAFHSQSPSIDFDDLVQEGNLGIMRAIETFDETKGNKFSTYAYNWIRQRIERFLANNEKIIRLPVHSGNYLRQLNKLFDQAEKEKQDSLTEKEKEDIIEKYRENHNITKECMYSILECSNSVSLNSVVGEDEHGEVSELGDFVAADMHTPEEDVELLMRKEYIAKMVSECLTEREQQVVKLRFGLEDGCVHTLEQVGQIMGVTRERIRQIEAKSIKKLRNKKRSFNINGWK